MTSSEQLSLNATTRTATKKQVAELRSQGMIPGIMYGHGMENTLVQVEQKALIAAYRESGENTLLKLVIDDGKPTQVLIHDIDRDPISDVLTHVDFFAVNMNEKVQAEVIVNFVGTSMAVKDLNGTLVKNRDHIAIKCLPGDLISEVEVDLALLEDFDSAIHISDIPFPDTVELLDSPELTLATVTPPRTEEELAALDEEVKEDVEAVEGAEEEKPEEAAEETKE